jgi:hypothetical protein
MTREEQKALGQAALNAMRRAVRRVREQHRKTGDPLYVLRDGRVTKVVLRPRRRAK